ncbi:hypothetical protein Hanom_Chr05g00417381 [Helianthus anomalus]
MHIVDGLRDSVLDFSVNVPGTTAKDVMDMVLVTQYFDTMKEIGVASKSYVVFIPHGSGALRDVATPAMVFFKAMLLLVDFRSLMARSLQCNRKSTVSCFLM